MFIEFTLSIAENYGSAEKPYWKQKGVEYQLLPVDKKELYAAADRAEYLRERAEEATRKVTVLNPMLEQRVVEWQLVEADHYTEHELNELAHEGHIRYWAELIELP